MGIFRRKKEKEQEKPEEKQAAKEGPRKITVKVPDFTKTEFMDLTPNQVEVWINRMYENKIINNMDRSLLGEMFKANRTFRQMEAEFRTEKPYKEWESLLDNGIKTGIVELDGKKEELDIGARSDFIMASQAIGMFRSTYRDLMKKIKERMEELEGNKE